MLSRLAEATYWMSRYLERAENVARFVDVNNQMVLDLQCESRRDQWLALIAASGDQNEFEKMHPKFSDGRARDFLIFDRRNANSILSCVTRARENAKQIKDSLPSEIWEQVNQLYQHVAYSKSRKNIDITQLLKQVKQSHHVIIGLTNSIMSHDEMWFFIRIGRFLERADKTSRMIDVKYFILLPSWEYVNSPLDAVQWGALLKSVSAFEMYRQRFHKINNRNVADFLIFDKYFPRSLLYCLKQVRIAYEFIARHHPAASKMDGIFRTQCHSIELQSIETITEQGLHQFIDDFQGQLNAMHELLSQVFFDQTQQLILTVPTRQQQAEQ